MAMTEEEARRLAEAFGELTSVIRASSEEEKRLAAEEREAAKAAELFKSKMDMATKTVGAISDAFVTYNKEIYKGTSAAKADAAAMEKLADAAEFAAAGLALLVPGGPIVKAVVAGLGLLAANLVKLNAETKRQTGDIYKAFQDLSKVGATGAAGMQGVFDSLMKVGLGTEKFGEYIKLIGDNAQDLALIGGSVRKGSDLFTKAMADLTDEQRVQMEVLVGDRQAQAEAGMAYIKQQRLLTAGTKQQMDTSSAAVMRYIKETDELTRITGLNRQEQEKQNEQAMRNEVFQAQVNEIRDKYGNDAANQVLAFNKALAATPKAQKAFQDGIGGFIGASEDAASQFFQTGGVVQDIGAQFRSGMIRTTEDTAEALKKFGTAVGNNAKEMSHLAKMNAYGTGVGMDYAEAIRLGQMATKISAKEVADAQQDQTDAIAAGLDMATAENDARRTQLAQQKLINIGMQDAIDSIALKAKADRVAAEAAYAAAAALNLIGGKGVKTTQEQAQAAATSSGTGGAVVGGGVIGGAGGEGDAAAIMAFAGGGPGAPTGGAQAPARPDTAPGGAAPAGAMGGGLPGYAPTRPEQVPQLAAIRELIASGESRGNYNIMVGGATYPLTTMTIGEVMQLQKKLIADKKGSAAGKYQIIYQTLTGIMGKVGLGMNDKFDEANQDKLADFLIRNRGFDQYSRNPTPEGKQRFLSSLSQEWASLPRGPDNQSYYAGVGNNKAHIGWDDALKKFGTGGIVTAPTFAQIGEMGPEAVVPLESGSIPVQMNESLSQALKDLSSEFKNGMDRMSQAINELQRTNMGAESLDVLRNIARSTSSTADFNSKMLSYAQN